jgi:hypothetical protein
VSNHVTTLGSISNSGGQTSSNPPPMVGTVPVYVYYLLCPILTKSKSKRSVSVTMSYTLFLSTTSLLIHASFWMELSV